MNGPKVFTASCYDRCNEQWVPQSVHLCKSDAIDVAYARTQNSVRCNRPMEWWRVEEHILTPCSGGNVVWGACDVHVGDCH